jgi:2-iminobutanoate/2-iminopropanoate deaminase
MTPVDPTSGSIVGATIQEQTRQSLSNVSAILEAAGSSLDRVVNVTVLLVNGDDFSGMNEEYVAWFPSNPPARHVTHLPVKIEGLKISISAVAEA